MTWLKSFWKALTTPMPRDEKESSDVAGYFTPRAQEVLKFSREEAARLNHNFVGTEHLLLGLVRLGQGTAVTVLANIGLDLETLRREVEKNVGVGPDQKVLGGIPYTPRVKRVLALAAKEAKALNHTYVGTEHILLGLLREGDGVAARVLQNLGADIARIRREILKVLDPNFTTTECDDSSQPESGALPSEDQKPEPVSVLSDIVDTTKRYDIHCAEGNREMVVYRNARFKGTKSLFKKHEYQTFCEFVELEEADGRTIFVARSSIVKFCEHRQGN